MLFQFVVWVALATGVDAKSADVAPRIYHSAAAHPANRVHQALFVRRDAHGGEYGHDAVDVLLWPNTKHLLDGASHDAAMKALTRLIESKDALEGLAPAARAVLQRDLWAAFDWTVRRDEFAATEPTPAIRDLRRVLYAAIRKLALTAEEITTLPDIYQQAVEMKVYPARFDAAKPDDAFLPPDLFDPRGGWVSLGEDTRTQADVYMPLVPRHVEGMSRSVFGVFIRLPEGRAATSAYIRQLNEFKAPYISDDRVIRPSPKLPEFTPGTQVALLRRGLLIDQDGRIQPTKLVESVQIRTYTPDRPRQHGRHERRQAVLELVLSPTGLLMKDKVALRPVSATEMGFSQFGDLSDPFENRGGEANSPVIRRIIHESCHGCHDNAGVRSFNTYTRSFDHSRTPPLLVESTLADRERATSYLKQTRHDWGVFQGLSEGGRN